MNAFTPPTRSTAGLLAQALLPLALIAGCASPTPSGPSGGPAPTGPGGGERAPAPRPAPPTVSPLVSEQRWLDEWFRGTPVLITMADANTLAVDIPLANSFDAGSSNIKPALAAVLDRVATSLRRQPSMRVSVGAPSDAGGVNAALAAARAEQVRSHLVSRGVPANRMYGVGTARPGSPVQLRLLVAAPQLLGRLDDANPLPAADGGRP